MAFVDRRRDPTVFNLDGTEMVKLQENIPSDFLLF